MKRVPESEWRWFGSVGHLIVGQWCRFHLATVVGPWLVSTVGHYVHPRHSAGSEQADAKWCRAHPDGEEIGADRFYETLVFKAGKPCDYEGCACGLPMIDGSEVDSGCYQTRAAANAGHLELCRKWANQPARGGSRGRMEGKVKK